ncbi:MAG: S8 family serine peptidase [Nostocaceae cyanobacterium]|nr:S8 family serine peptidase [Nostocaceae cyanobacterium]
MSPIKPRVKLEAEYIYTNKFSNKQIRFYPKQDEVVATLQQQSLEETEVEETQGAENMFADVMRTTSLAMSQGINLDHGVTVFQVDPNQDMEVVTTSLNTQPQIANAMPVMLDEEGNSRYFLPDEFTVQFRPGVSKEEALNIIQNQGSQILVEQRTPGYYTLNVPAGQGLFETLRQFSNLDEVAFAEPSEIGFDDELVYIPDDPDFPKLWGLHNTGQVVNGISGTFDADIDAIQAWDINQGNPEVIVAVIDTGTDLDHPDLEANILLRGTEDWDFADAGDPCPDDPSGHGTHVAGTIAAVDNKAGIIGVAPKCRIMPLRVNLKSGMNQNRADAINYVAAQAIAYPKRRYVINCSWKMSGDHAGVHQAIINAITNNVVVVFAAGNSARDIDVQPQYPAIYPEVIAVAATDQNDQKAGFSNYGSKVDVAAPGVNIYSTYPDDRYAFLQGTSMASPHVAGLAALIWSRNPSLSNHEVREIIEKTCDNIDSKNPSYIGKLGKGRINARKALRATPLPPVSFQFVRKLKFPQKNNGSSTGLAFARHIRIGYNPRSVLLFVTQQPGTERIYYLNPKTGSVLKSVDPTGNDTIGSLVWDGNYIRVANVTTGSGSINSINSNSGNQVNSIPAPSGRGEGLAYDGTYLYYSTINRIHVLNANTGAVIRSFVPPGGACRSLTYGKGYLFSGNSNTGKITIFDPKTLAIRDTIPALGGGNNQVDGLAFSSCTSELYIANQSENLIYVVQLML